MLDSDPAIDVSEAEFRRLLGYPAGHVPGERARELSDMARRHYAERGRPWIYTRRVEAGHSGGMLYLDGREFRSERLRDFLAGAGAGHAVLIAVSAGRGCEDDARALWNESKPDEYFFLEVFGSAVVERLVSLANARICEEAEQDNLSALPHYSPGYTGWDVADQEKLFELIKGGMTRPLPEPLEVLQSGMLRPRKSMLAVAGLVERGYAYQRLPSLAPCQTCSFSPCQYRRAPYLHSPAPNPGARMEEPQLVMAENPAPLARGARYSVSARALRKWAGERVRLAPLAGGGVRAFFRFDGTTCSNLGRPLAFDYVVDLGPPGGGYAVLDAQCRPAPGDTGHRFMCAYLNDAAALMAAIGADKPLLGRPLDDVLAWRPAAATTGCHCDAASRAHKWILALEAIHYALAHDGPWPSSGPG
jgi:hypothetical protein